MSKNNSNAIVFQAKIYILNINKLLKGMKSEVLADFIYFNNKRIIITTNKAVVTSDLNVMEKCIKKLFNLNDIMSSCLP